MRKSVIFIVKLLESWNSWIDSWNGWNKIFHLKMFFEISIIVIKIHKVLRK